MVIPDTKQKIVDDTSQLAKDYEQQYNDGLITRGEKYTRWSTPGRRPPTASPRR